MTASSFAANALLRPAGSILATIPSSTAATALSSYAAVAADGPAADHVLAFDRGGSITVVTRLPLGLEARGGWGETVLLLPDGTRRVGDVLGDGPVALLVKED